MSYPHNPRPVYSAGSVFMILIGQFTPGFDFQPSASIVNKQSFLLHRRGRYISEDHVIGICNTMYISPDLSRLQIKQATERLGIFLHGEPVIISVQIQRILPYQCAVSDIHLWIIMCETGDRSLADHIGRKCSRSS